jgi:hypothetical protein
MDSAAVRRRALRRARLRTGPRPAPWHNPCSNEFPDSPRVQSSSEPDEIWMRGFEKTSA